MKFKTTLILFVAFVALLAFVLLFEEFKGKGEKDEKGKLVALSSDDVQKITLKRESDSITFEKTGEDDKQEWVIVEPLAAKADKYEVDRLADNFSDLRIERVVEEEPEDLEKYEIPKKEITLWFKDREKPVRILLGAENPLDNTLFAKREDEARVVLIPSYLKSTVEKSLFDFRQKDIFRFETGDVKTIKLRAKESRWEAEKKEDGWFLKRPVAALAKDNKITGILNSLSGLKAKEFVTEEKNKEEVAQFELDRPDYEVALTMPVENQEVTFFLHKKDEKLYATTSLSSKIIEAEDSLLSELGEAVADLREKKVANFYSWEVNRLQLKWRELDWVLVKDEDDNWKFESPVQEEADKSKVQTFIRKIESLEAEEFIDPPLDLKDYGLDEPQGEVKVWVKEDEENFKEITILLGAEDKEAKKVVVKNALLDYLFRLDSAFLEEFPKELKDWKPEVKEEAKEEKDKKGKNSAF
ncbi:MAG: DUF4340 domain-containing protein [Candidatus Aminicenantes bacterium]|nr:DUF4340 domain-containing protein [Candidatus Aminicenantes bacterium]